MSAAATATAASASASSPSSGAAAGYFSPAHIVAPPLVAPLYAAPSSYERVDLSTIPNPCAHVKSVSIIPREFPEPRRPVNFEDGWSYFRKIGSPKFICAPMVNQSELPFRILCRKYNTTLAYTPMFHAEIFGKDPSYRRDTMQVPSDASLDRPVVAQFCANDPELLLKAAKHVEHCVDAVDINLGCPQGIAKRGFYGSFLLEEYQLLHDMVSTLHQYLSIPVTCKIRRLPESAGGDQATIALVKMLEEAGAALITIHGRSRFQLKDKVGAADFDLIRLVKQNASIPVFANGGIFDQNDVERCLAYTGVDGVMSSEALLCNPSLFSGQRIDSLTIAREYLSIVKELETKDGLLTDQSAIRAHLFKFLYQHISILNNHDLREKLAHCDPGEFSNVVEEIAQRFEGMNPIQAQELLNTVPLWYHRHLPTETQIKAKEEKAKKLAAEREEALNDPERIVDDGLCGAFDMFDTDCGAGEQGCSSAQQQEA